MPTEETPVVLPVHTSCKDCVFAIYPVESHTQNGCHLGRLNKYLEQKSVVEAYDEEKEFFVVNGTRCHAYRPKSWIGEHGPANLISDVRKELTVKVDLIVELAKGNVFGWNIDSDMMSSPVIESCKAQTTPFNQVIFVNNGACNPEDLIAYLREQAEGLDWKMVHLFEPQTRGFAIDHAQNNVKGGFYTLFDWRCSIPSSFVADIDKAINDDLQRFVYLYPNQEGNGEVVQVRFHKHVGGNALTQTMKDGFPTGPVLSSVREKVDELKSQPEFNMHAMVRNVTEICPSLK